VDIYQPLQVRIENTAGCRNDLKNMYCVVEDGLHLFNYEFGSTPRTDLGEGVY